MSVLLDFLAELVKRFFGKSPYFFKVVQIVSAIIGIISGLPTALTAMGVDLPDSWDSWILKAVSAASIGALFIAKLTLTQSAKDKLNLPEK